MIPGSGQLPTPIARSAIRGARDRGFDNDDTCKTQLSAFFAAVGLLKRNSYCIYQIPVIFVVLSVTAKSNIHPFFSCHRNRPHLCSTGSKSHGPTRTIVASSLIFPQRKNKHHDERAPHETLPHGHGPPNFPTGILQGLSSRAQMHQHHPCPRCRHGPKGQLRSSRRSHGMRSHGPLALVGFIPWRSGTGSQCRRSEMVE